MMQINNLYFIKRDPNRLNYLLEIINMTFYYSLHGRKTILLVSPLIQQNQACKSLRIVHLLFFGSKIGLRWFLKQYG
jgi:hypothetical protein